MTSALPSSSVAGSADPLVSIAGFAALLREHGMKVGVAEQQAFVQAALAVPVARSAKLDAAWRAIACRDARDWRRWPDLFERYWHPQRLTGSVRVSGQTRPSRDIRRVVQSLHDQLGDSAPRREDARRAMDTALSAAPAAGESQETTLLRAPRAAPAAPIRCTTARYPNGCRKTCRSSNC